MGKVRIVPARIFFRGKCFLNILDEAMQAVPRNGFTSICIILYIGMFIYILMKLSPGTGSLLGQFGEGLKFVQAIIWNITG